MPYIYGHHVVLSQQRQRRSWLWLRAIALVVAVIVLLLTVGCKNQDNGVASVLVVGSVEVAPPSGVNGRDGHHG